MSARCRGWIIHDATGKFSSRWPLPERHSLALVIENRCPLKLGAPAPYRRIQQQNQCNRAPAASGSGGAYPAAPWRRLLAVVCQNLTAGFGQFGPILLQAVQDDQVGLIHERPTILLDIVCAGFLLFGRAAPFLLWALLLLGEGGCGDGQ